MSKLFEMCPNCNTYLDERDSQFCSLCGYGFERNREGGLEWTLYGGKGEDNDIQAYGDIYNTIIRMINFMREHDIPTPYTIISHKKIWQLAQERPWSFYANISEFQKIMELEEINYWEVDYSMKKCYLILCEGIEQVETINGGMIFVTQGHQIRTGDLTVW